MLLIRHAYTEWSRSGQHTGLTDLELDEGGRRLATALGAMLGDLEPPGLVLCSALRRARETCRLVGFTQHVEYTDDLLEWDYGDYEGRTTEQIRGERPGWSLWRDGVPGGERIEDVAARADRVVARLREAGGTVAVVAHGHVLRVLASRWLGVEPQFGAHLALDACSLGVLGHEREVPVLRLWNHLVE